ncbi:MAG: DUF1801 domain-containing protein [Planctomycetes bacterium]|nr:DUF1801 domain-containing protein [Planctomycetota bacterium]
MKQLRALIHAAAPQARDAWSYGIPAFELHGRMLVWYAAWKTHIGLYPVGAEFVRARGGGAKGTIRFPFGEPPTAGIRCQSNPPTISAPIRADPRRSAREGGDCGNVGLAQYRCNCG